MKHSKFIAVTLTVLMIPAFAFSAEKFTVAKAIVGSDNTVTVPLQVSNEDDLMAIEIPLSFSEGVTLKEVSFEGTRVAEFDLKLAKIDNEANTVIVALIHQITSSTKATLDAGEGTVANLIFEVDDPSVTVIKLDPMSSDIPGHRLTYVYARRSNPDQVPLDETQPPFEGVSVALSAGAGSGLPTSYALEQNYPNPFNPTTEIAFSLPVASQVQVDIFNVLGQRVISLVNEDMPAGNHTVTWNGDNFDGAAVSSGVYFYRITAADFSQTRKMMMLK